MPVSFDPLPPPRFDQSLLSYLGQSFQKISAAIKSLSSRQTLAPKYYTVNSGSIAVGTGAALFTNLSILTAPYPLIMEVEISGTGGFSGGASQWDIDILDQGFASIALPGVHTNISSGAAAAGWVPHSIIGKREYNTNDVCGTQINVWCGVGTNVYFRLGIKVSFYPK